MCTGKKRQSQRCVSGCSLSTYRSHLRSIAVTLFPSLVRGKGRWGLLQRSVIHRHSLNSRERKSSLISEARNQIPMHIPSVVRQHPFGFATSHFFILFNRVLHIKCVGLLSILKRLCTIMNWSKNLHILDISLSTWNNIFRILHHSLFHLKLLITKVKEI